MRISLVFVFFLLFLTACIEQGKKEVVPSLTAELPNLEVPNITIDQAKLEYQNKVSLWMLNGKRFSGYALRYSPDSILIKKFGILNGQKQNEAKDWFPDGRIKHIAHYHQGKLHGEKKTWSHDSTHLLISHLNYRLGKAHGEQKKWYPTGELFKVLHLNMGKEEGLQRGYRKNGDLFANYEAREGRIFGLKKTALCFGLEDEKIQNAK